MEFRLTEEQTLIRESARRFFETECGFAARGKVIEAGGFNPDHWAFFSEMAWLGIAIPEAYGGFGGTLIDQVILLEEMGRALFVEPYWSVCCLAAPVILAADDDVNARRLLPELIAGTGRPALAHCEAEARGRVEFVTTTAFRQGERWILSGSKPLVFGGNIADRFIVSARTAGDNAKPDGITLFVVDRNAPGLHVHPARLIDNSWGAQLALRDVIAEPSDVLGEVNKAYGALRDAHDKALISLCAEAIGVMDKALWITRDYLKTRKQFGTALSTFQVLQHRMSDMLIELELARGMVYRALAHLNADRATRDQTISAMKYHIGRSGKFVCGQAIQLHGGIGVAEEYEIGHYFKRMTMIEYALGHSHYHLEQLAALERALPPQLRS